MNGQIIVPGPINEPVLSYAPGTPERRALREALETGRAGAPYDIPLVIEIGRAHV